MTDKKIDSMMRLVFSVLGFLVGTIIYWRLFG